MTDRVVHVARAIIQSPDYQAWVLARIRDHTLSEDVELALWELAAGRGGRRMSARAIGVGALERDLTRHKPTLAFAALSHDEVDARRTAAALDGDVEQVAALTKYQEMKT